MVPMVVRARPVPVLVVLAALVVGVVGPCLCALRAAETRAAHDCCDAEMGLKAAAPDCCTTCTATLRAPAPAVPEKDDASAIPAVVALPLRLVPAALVASVARLDASCDASSPPTILRI
jgi:hypothetical protein